jgi:hypothetical protein
MLKLAGCIEDKRFLSEQVHGIIGSKNKSILVSIWRRGSEYKGVPVE